MRKKLNLFKVLSICFFVIMFLFGTTLKIKTYASEIPIIEKQPESIKTLYGYDVTFSIKVIRYKFKIQLAI